MAVILRVFISFSSVLRALNFAFNEASFINRYSHYSCTVQHTNRGWQAWVICKNFLAIVVLSARTP